ncbi:uncharacterized protein METZ01_LOCUS467286, partial [marine metagenome]
AVPGGVGDFADDYSTIEERIKPVGEISVGEPEAVIPMSPEEQVQYYQNIVDSMVQGKLSGDVISGELQRLLVSAAGKGDEAGVLAITKVMNAFGKSGYGTVDVLNMPPPPRAEVVPGGTGDFRVIQDAEQWPESESPYKAKVDPTDVLDQPAPLISSTLAGGVGDFAGVFQSEPSGIIKPDTGFAVDAGDVSGTQVPPTVASNLAPELQQALTEGQGVGKAFIEAQVGKVETERQTRGVRNNNPFNIK